LRMGDHLCLPADHRGPGAARIPDLRPPHRGIFRSRRPSPQGYQTMKLLLAALLTLACLAPTFANEPGYTSADEQAMQLCVETVNDINNDPNPGDTVTLTEC